VSARAPTAPPSARARRADRGAALLVVTVALAVLTAFAVDLAYETRVGVQAAVNGRDELRALYEAKSAVAVARVVLSLQAQLDRRTAAMTATPQLAGMAPRIQIWNVVPVGSGLAAMLFAGKGEAEGAPAGPPPGSFDAKLQDEAAKVNAQLDGGASTGLLAGQLAAWFDLVGDRKWDFLFDREDENGLKVSRNDLAIYLHDWVDDGSTTSGLTGNPAKPFEDAFGDENYPYDRGPDRYRTKNGRFDSLDELYLVAGVTDAFMAAFGDQLTVYVRRDGKFTISNDPEKIMRAARIMADPPNQPTLMDPSFPEKLQKAVADATWGVRMLSASEFAGLLRALNVVLRSEYQTQTADQRGAFGPPPGVYRIQATGTAGDVTKVVDAVVTFDPNQLGNRQSPLGRLLHWRED
jgi:general secretion pathway protein K